MHRIGPLLVVLVVACSTTDKPAADTGEAAGTGTGLPGTAGPGTGGSATGGTGTGGTATGSGSATGGPGTGTATGGTGTGGSATGSGTATGGSGTGTGGSGTGGTATGSGTATGGPGTGTSGTATGSGTGTATGTATGGTGTGTGDPYRDADGDGFPGSEDCDDDDPLVFPGAEEICDGLPTACAGLPPDEIDDDRDGYVECVPEGWRGALILGGEDCDDTNPDAYPRATEVCDGVLTDCNLAGLLEIESDLDGDGFVGCTIDAGGWDGDPAVIGGDDCDDADDTVFPGAPELCDGVANACGDLPDAERDLDLDGWVACAIDPAGWRGDPVLGGGDCDDADPTRFPTAREACDGVDNACTGGLPDDEVDGDGDGFVACDVIGDWFGPPIDGGGDCDPEDGAVFPGAVEVCNGIDDDCNLLTDDRDPGLDPDTLLEWWVDLDGDGFGADGDPLLLCDLPGGVRAPGDCDDFDADRYPGAPEWCDGLLQDCDGEAEGRVATFFRDGDPPEDWTAALAGEVELVGPGTLALCDGVWGVRLALGGPSLTIEGRGDVTLDGMGDGATILNLARNLTVSGVTITGGVAGATAAGLEGGVGNTLTLTDVRFVDNEGGAVGGALHTEGGRLTVEACRFEGNTAALGGGVYTVDTVASYTDSHLERNDASDGGALRVEGGTADLVGTTITLNTAARGGGVFATSAAAVTCDGGVIASNTADEGGGARIDAATLGLVDCDMGTDPDDNAPEDVWTPVGGFDWAGLATSFCDGAGCR